MDSAREKKAFEAADCAGLDLHLSHQRSSLALNRRSLQRGKSTTSKAVSLLLTALLSYRIPYLHPPFVHTLPPAKVITNLRGADKMANATADLKWYTDQIGIALKQQQENGADHRDVAQKVAEAILNVLKSTDGLHNATQGKLSSNEHSVVSTNADQEDLEPQAEEQEGRSQTDEQPQATEQTGEVEEGVIVAKGPRMHLEGPPPDWLKTFSGWFKDNKSTWPDGSTKEDDWAKEPE